MSLSRTRMKTTNRMARPTISQARLRRAHSSKDGLSACDSDIEASEYHRKKRPRQERKRSTGKERKNLTTKNAARHSRNREFNHKERKDHKERRSDRKPRNTPATPKKAADIP